MKHQPLFALLAVLALLTGLAAGGLAPARASVFGVDDNSDDANAHDKNPGDGTCLSWYNTCTLRAAIEEANALGGAHTITFVNGMNISLDSTAGTLAINTQIRLDASGVWDTANDRPGVSISGINQNIDCLYIYGINVEVYGLFIYNCDAAIAIYSSNNTIGGALQGQRNVLSSNAGPGVYLGTSGAHDNVIQGNWIGLSLSGDSKASNNYGVYITDGAADNTIGGDTPAKGNFISGSIIHGVAVNNASGNRLGGNTIGLPALGSQNVGNGGAGVFVSNGAQNTQIGGLSGLTGNTISKNGAAGVYLSGAHSNVVEVNTISGNALDGVYVLNGANNRIQANTIAANGRDGVRVEGATANGNTITANGIHDNGGKGIELVSGGNYELAAPAITSANSGGASGTGCAWCAIHLYSDTADEGAFYHGWTTADGSGNWSYSGFLTGPNVTATNTGSCGQQIAAPTGCNDTSEFSAPFAIGAGGQFKVFLPFVVRNH